MKWIRALNACVCAFICYLPLAAANAQEFESVRQSARVRVPTQWKTAATWDAPEAHQAAAIAGNSFFAISSTQVAKYDKSTGQRVAVSTGPATHLNSGFWWKDRLLCAHSNYPRTPEISEIKSLDPESMQLITYREFGDFGGSLTWVVRDEKHWWCQFAKYGARNAESFLVQFDDDWKELSRWTYPPEVIRELGQYSLSGGVWRGNLLHVTGHDDRVIFRLRLPLEGRALEFVDKQPAPFTGQGIAVSPEKGELIGIDRGQKKVILARLEVAVPQPRLPRERLLVRRKAEGQLEDAANRDVWNARRSEIMTAVQSVMGPLPGREKAGSLEMRVEEEVDQGQYVRRLISYASEPDSRVTAYLCLPKSALAANPKPHGAVLCLHGTDNVIGHGTVVGLGRPNRQYASELAERGFVTLAPSYPLLAKYQPDVHALGWESGTLKAVWDNMRGLDLLDSLPFVKPGEYGVIGHSLGGHNSVYTAIFDERIKAVVSSCGLDSFLDYYGGDEKHWYFEKGWCQTRYMPRLAEYRGRLPEIPFDFHELIGALAPRSVLIIAPLHDSNFKADSVDRVAAAARPVFELESKADRLRVEHPDCPHDFPPEMRAAGYEWIARALGR